MENSLDFAAYLGIPVWLIAIVTIWSLVWMGIAMWKSARKNNWIWFIVFLLIHTVGILEILYIFVFSKIGSKTSSPKPAKKKKR